MAFDPKTLMNDPTFIAAIEAGLKAAYEQGASDTLARIVAAARAPGAVEAAAPTPTVTPTPSAPAEEAAGASTSYNPRAPRGLVRQVLVPIMKTMPGLLISEYETLAIAEDSRMSPKSIGNELRRGEGKAYERRGYRWYLLDAETNEAPDTAREEGSDASSVSSNHGGPHGAALA